ncbi:ABC transporter permease [Chitinophaga sp. CF418]|uniref:ABC transporter permease n=1 Tax=Chitinophaga sp. CF418 TaxID=1855287 RepID=UPI0009103CF0|nr:ABC transporter permease [Chitinophaga sp. CF418]SHM37934.1 ABC-type transport system, involved in lipoprotein release, permease component [Chitinophaga sp. CF418]
MIKNYLKIAWRNLWRNRVFSSINIAGLGIGMAVSFTLILYVLFQFSYDDFHKNNSYVYHVKVGDDGGSNTPVPLGPLLQKSTPEIKEVIRASYPAPHLLKAGDKSLKLSGFYTDPKFLDVFTFPVIKGQGLLKDENTIILTESTASKLFGNADPIGQIVNFDIQHPLVVTAVIKDPPSNSTLQFSYLLSWALFRSAEPWVREEEWGNFGINTFVQLVPKADPAIVAHKIRNVLHEQKAIIPATSYLLLHSMSKWKLYGEIKNGKIAGGEIAAVRLFALLALGILLIACVNFMNLSTAQSERRAKEVGVRKSVGANRRALIWQFMNESLLLVGISLLLALALMWGILPTFNMLTNSSLQLSQAPASFWLAIVLLALFTAIVSGSYPAFVLSAFKPVKVLKGGIVEVKGNFRPRQVLVMFQFTLAIVLIFVTIVIYRQINYIRNLPIGYDPKGLVDIQLEGNVYDDYDAFRQEVIGAGAAVNGSATLSSIAQAGASMWALKWPGQLPGEENINFGVLTATENFVSTFGITLKEGRDFLSAGDSLSMMLNETAVKTMHLKEPVVGQQVRVNGQDRTITGVVKDFVWMKSYMPATPVVIPYNPGWRGFITMKLNPQLSVSECLRRMEKIYRSFNPDYPFQYTFVDETYKRKYAYEQVLGVLINVFATLAIMISCLGLLGLSVFAAARRKKEIGIRKVLGAGITQVTVLLSKEFLKPVLVAILVASPIASYVMMKWLQHYTYRISLEWWIYLLAGMIAIVIALLTVSIQSVKAASMNPVKALRSE